MIRVAEWIACAKNCAVSSPEGSWPAEQPQPPTEQMPAANPAPAPAEPGWGQPAYSTPANEAPPSPPYQQAPAEQPPYQQAPAEQPPYQQAPFQPSEYTVPPVYGDAQYPPAPQPEQPYPAAPYSAAPYSAQPYSGQPYSAPPQQDPYATPQPEQPYSAPPQQTYGQTQPYGQQPAQPQYGQPAQAQYGQPAQPQYGQPAQPQFGQPAPTMYQQPGAYQQPGWGQPAAPPKRSKTPLIIGIVVAAVLLLGCGGVVALIVHRANEDTPIASPTTSGPGPSHSASAAASATHDADLTTYLVKAPSGSTPWTTKPNDEVLDLAAAADFGADSSVWNDLLTQWGFTRGIARHWRTSDDQIVEVTLFQFDHASGAAGFFGKISSATAASDEWDIPITAPGTGGGKVFASSTTDDNGYDTQLGMATVGDVFINITVSAKPPMDDNACADLLLNQATLL